MDLFKDILIHAIRYENINILFPDLKMNMTEIIELECYKTLEKIKAIIKNDSLSDFECIEEIICVFEDIGNEDCGGRHDFG